jgi:hypothetical protein
MVNPELTNTCPENPRSEACFIVPEAERGDKAVACSVSGMSSPTRALSARRFVRGLARAPRSAVVDVLSLVIRQVSKCGEPLKVSYLARTNFRSWQLWIAIHNG